VSVGGSDGVAVAMCAVTVVGTRGAALVYGWSLPTAQRLGVTRK
jgi:hypothetical protein